jgi:very-short-patch-repair endonuclease
MSEYLNRSSEKDKRRQLRAAMPTAEVILWSRIRRRQLLGCKFRRQYSVGSYVIDFFSAEARLGIELDGDSHFESGAPAYDQRRQQFIESFGIRTIRILNEDVYENLDRVLEMIGRDVVGRRASARQR